MFRSARNDVSYRDRSSLRVDSRSSEGTLIEFGEDISNRPTRRFDQLERGSPIALGIPKVAWIGLFAISGDIWVLFSQQPEDSVREVNLEICHMVNDESAVPLVRFRDFGHRSVTTALSKGYETRT